MPSPSCVRSVLENLGSYLKSKMPSLSQVIYEFPAPNVQLKYPTLSIIAGNPIFTPLQPYLLSQGAILKKKAAVKSIVGSYDLTLQLDLWCRDKLERFELYEQFFSAFNAQVNPMGLSLQMNDYHGVWCRYDLTGYDLADDEMQSQKSEWRAKIKLIANTRAVIEKSELMIETIENNLTLSNSDDLAL